MKSKTKSALIFGGFIFFNSSITMFFTTETFNSKDFIINILSAFAVAIVLGYLFGFVLKASFGWKNKKEDIRK
ncbi:MAG: hypothetical protein ABI136_00835 [Ginsengibacter sp.]